MASDEQLEQATCIFYDDTCAFCRQAVAWVARQEKDDTQQAWTYRPLAQQQPPPLQTAHHGARPEGMQIQDAQGRCYTGHAAIRAILMRLPRWRWLTRLWEWPLGAWLAPRVYGWVSRNRHAISKWLLRQ
jgi:predicted DCC family thiol-disulfide oxidoreductase YuxK